MNNTNTQRGHRSWAIALSLACGAASLWLAANARATVNVSTSQNTDPTVGYVVSNTDLLQTEFSSVSSPNLSAFFVSVQASTLRPRCAMARSERQAPADAGVGICGGAGRASELTYFLNTSLNTLGYTITEVDTYASHAQGRAGQT